MRLERLTVQLKGGELQMKRRSAGSRPSWAPEDFGVIDFPNVACMTPRLTPMPLLTHAEKLHLERII
jgi:hypothetical protein